MSELSNMLSVSFAGLTNGQSYNVRVYPMNPKGYAQSEIGTQVGSATPMEPPDLAALPEGSIVMLNESGTPVPFYVAKHNYESDLNENGRTLLVRKDCYDLRVWDTTINRYAKSALDSWFNNDYKSLLDADIQTAIGTTQFYYTPMDGTDGWLVYTLSRSVFALSVAELSGSNNATPNKEGSLLPIAATLRTVYCNGSQVKQWCRTPYTGTGTTAFVCSSTLSKEITTTYCWESNGARPCFTLPATMKVSVKPNADGSYSLL